MLSDPNEYTYIADTLKQTIITRHAESEGRVCTIAGRRRYPEVERRAVVPETTTMH